MFLPPSKKNFLHFLGGGLRVLLVCSYKGDDIYLNASCAVEEFIRDRLMTDGSFCESKFSRFVDSGCDEDVLKVLMYFDDIDMCIQRVYYESSLPMDDAYASLIENGTIMTFEDFIKEKS